MASNSLISSAFTTLTIVASFARFIIYYGHGDILEARIQSVDLAAHPERQFRVVVKLKDNRPEK